MHIMFEKAWIIRLEQKGSVFFFKLHINLLILCQNLEDIIGEENEENIVLLPPHLMTRKSLQLDLELGEERN